ncbi:MAG: deoxyguanosinetriphosphate triphosphohydrolase [Desulfobacteraceae bacterium]|jgi:dGTPase
MTPRAHQLRQKSTAVTLREEFENREANFMSPYGCLSANSQGRSKPEKACSIRTAFQIDKDRILFSNAFRRLKLKTQVFLNPSGDEYRTRLTHTLEVAQIARTIARAMFLNEDLAEAIALGHDLGHTPFGHGGELVLKEIFSSGFSHQAQSLRVVQLLENFGKGLNLTYEVRDGILRHSKGYGKIIPDNPKELPSTVEGRVVRVADIMAYLNHDLDDAIRSGVVRETDTPDTCVAVLGRTHDDRVTTMMTDLIAHSRPGDGQMILNMSDGVFEAMTELRKFLYEKVYRSSKVHNEFVKAKKIMSELFTHFLDDETLLAHELEKMRLPALGSNGASKERLVCDLLACMTDRYALSLYARIFFPSPSF